MPNLKTFWDLPNFCMIESGLQARPPTFFVFNTNPHDCFLIANPFGRSASSWKAAASRRTPKSAAAHEGARPEKPLAAGRVSRQVVVCARTQAFRTRHIAV